MYVISWIVIVFWVCAMITPNRGETAPLFQIFKGFSFIFGFVLAVLYLINYSY